MANKESFRSNKYLVVSLAEISKIEKKKRSAIVTSYIVEYNGAFAIIFADKTALLAPPVLGGEEGLFFYDVADMKAMIASRTFPVKGNGSFWEKEKARILDFQNEIPYYCGKLSELLEFHVVLNTDKLYFQKLDNVIAARLKLKKSKVILEQYLSIYIAELVRLKIGGEWKLLKQNGLNVYYIPEIVKNEKFCTPWHVILGQLEMASFIPVDVQNLVDKAAELYPRGKRSYSDHK